MGHSIQDCQHFFELLQEMMDEKQEQKGETKNREEQYCQYHKGSVGHPIQDCQDFLDLVQEMMNEGKIEFCKEVGDKS